MRRTVWTGERLELLAKLRQERMPVKEMAKALGVTFRSLSHKLYEKTPKESYGTYKKLSDEEIAWLKENFSDMLNKDICRELGISYSRLHAIVRRFGLKKSEALMKRTQLAAASAAYQSHMENGTFPPIGFQIPNSEQARFQKGAGVWARVSQEKAKEMKAKAQATLKRTRDRERARIVWGFEQRTKLRLVRQSASKINFRYGLRRLGYIEDPSDHNVYYYTDKTTRRPAKEGNAKKHNVRIYPYPQS